VNIAQGALRILRHPRVKPYVDLPRMSELAEEMVRDALNAVVRRDVDLAQKVLAPTTAWITTRPDFRELLTYMMGDSSVVFPAFELILVAKNLERIGDHATTSPRTSSTSSRARTSATPQSTAANPTLLSWWNGEFLVYIGHQRGALFDLYVLSMLDQANGPKSTVRATAVPTLPSPSLPLVPRSLILVSPTRRYSNRKFNSPPLPIIPAFFACVTIPTAFAPALATVTSPNFQVFVKNRFTDHHLPQSLSSSPGQTSASRRCLPSKSALQAAPVAEPPEDSGYGLCRLGRARASCAAP